MNRANLASLSRFGGVTVALLIDALAGSLWRGRG
jgi:hypothetical protein